MSPRDPPEEVDDSHVIVAVWFDDGEREPFESYTCCVCPSAEVAHQYVRREFPHSHRVCQDSIYSGYHLRFGPDKEDETDFVILLRPIEYYGGEEDCR